MFQSISIFSLYNPLFQCFETQEMGPGILTFLELVSILFQFCFETFGPSQFLSCFSPFQGFETPEMGPGIFIFLELVSILFRNN